MRLITYGKIWDRARFSPVRNSNSCLNKPTGGLWASPVGAKYGWKEWCKEQEFETATLLWWFEFTLVGRVLTIDTVEDLMALPWVPLPYQSSFEIIDFESLASEYDAIHLTSQGEMSTKWDLNRSLRGWDCESVLVMNPNSVTNVKTVHSREYAKLALQMLDNDMRA